MKFNFLSSLIAFHFLRNSQCFEFFEDFSTLNRWQYPDGTKHRFLLKQNPYTDDSIAVGGGLVTSAETEEPTSYLISSRLRSPFSNANSTLVFQVTYQERGLIECSKFSVELLQGSHSTTDGE